MRQKLDQLTQIEKILEELKVRWQELESKSESLDQELLQLEKSSAKESKENCEGLLGYEDDATGDGMVAFYYDNESFDG